MIPLKNRLYSLEALKQAENAQVTVSGWVKLSRVVGGKLAFITLRDREGSLQLTLKADVTKGFDALKDVTPESVVSAHGKMVKGKQKSGDMELLVEEFEVVSIAATPLPIDMTGTAPTALDKRLDHRFMDLRNPEVAAIFKIRSQINASIRDYLLKNNFIEMQTPKIAGAGAEGGSTVFKFKYYEKEAFLSQSQQFYKQFMMAAGFDRIFEIGPSFRAEKSHTKRHLAEFVQLDFEMAFIDSEEDVMKMLEGLLVYVTTDVAKKCSTELEILKKHITVPKHPFPRIPHAECIKMLQSAGSKIKAGEDIGSEDERVLGKVVKEKMGADAYFITQFPWDIRAFYTMKKENGLSTGFDLEFQGLEIVSGAQREHRFDHLVQNIKDKGLDPKDLEFYTWPFKHGMCNHGGFGLGIDRLTKELLQLDEVREAVLFPRTPERVLP